MRDAVGETAQRMLDIPKTISSATQVKEQVQPQDKKISLATVRTVLMKDYGLRFGKVKRIPNNANTLRNLHMRQQFGKKMLDLLSSGKRILNVDETWIGQTNFSRREWRSKDAVS